MKKKNAKKPKTPSQSTDPSDSAVGAAVPSRTGTLEPEGEQETAAPQTVDELHQKIDKLSDSLLRAKADFQNLLRRGAIERADAIRYANAELMKSLLGVIDDFERSVAAMETSDNFAAVADGIRLVQENFLKALRVQGLETIDVRHEPFDPTIHEALMEQPSDEHPVGTVVEQISRGYRLRDRVLRPARVVVSKGTGAAPATTSDAPERESAPQ